MPDTRSHRGAHPRDADLFDESGVAVLRRAVDDLSWLLGRGYPVKAAAALVGDRHTLRTRQRKAVRRCAAAAADVAARTARRVEPAAMAGRSLEIDGYNVLLTVEAALGGGVILRGRDGCYRDMAAMSRHYKRVEETARALEHLGRWLAARAVAPVRWLFDRPVSNSGRLRALMLELATAHDWPWAVDLVADPDKPLAVSRDVIATADSAVLDAPVAWLDLARHVVDDEVVGGGEAVWLVDLGCSRGADPERGALPRAAGTDAGGPSTVSDHVESVPDRPVQAAERRQEADVEDADRGTRRGTRR